MNRLGEDKDSADRPASAGKGTDLVPAGAAGRLAVFAADAHPGADALGMLRLSLFDWAVCAIAGTREPVATILRQVEAQGAAHPGVQIGAPGAPEQPGNPLSDMGEASVAGSPVRFPARTAALINGATGHALDYGDWHPALGAGIAAPILPAVLALAEARGSGAGVLSAAVIGAEAAIRLGHWLGASHSAAGFDPTATTGALGAALGAGRVLELDADAMRHALGIAANRATGLTVQGGTMAKPLAAGAAAETGVLAARLAAAGMTAAADALSGSKGFGVAHSGQTAEAAWEGLGTEWRVLGLTHKAHACCQGLHAMLDALQGLNLAPEAVDRVTVALAPKWKAACDLPAPTTGLAAKYSVQLTAAMALAGWNTADPGSFSDAACHDPALMRLRDRVSVVANPGLAELAVEIYLDAGTRNHVLRHDLRKDGWAADLPVGQGGGPTLGAKGPGDTKSGIVPAGGAGFGGGAVGEGRSGPGVSRSERLRHKARALLGQETADALWRAAANAAGPDIAALTAALRTAPTA